MSKNYFLRLLKVYCKDVHNMSICDECSLLLEKYNDSTIDSSDYYKIISYSGWIYKRFHFYTFNRISKLKYDDLTKN